MSKKIDRRSMRKIAVDCVYAYDFVLEEERTREIKPFEEPVKAPKRSTVIINKQLPHGRRRLKMKTEEYEARKRQLQEWFPEDYKDPDKAEQKPLKEDNEPETFDVQDFIVNFCESSGVIGEGTFDDDAFRAQPDYEEYLYPVVSGIVENIAEIDSAISKASKGWTVDRMKKTDLAILRVAAFELIYMKDKIPVQVSVNEAVELAKAEDEKSGSYVNGVLAGIVKAL